MLKTLGRTAACGALLGLAACSGGGGNYSSGGDDTGVPLDSKADALRELAMIGTIFNSFDGVGLGSEAGIAPKAATGRAWPPIVQPSRAVRAKATACLDGGQTETTSGVASHVFAFYGGRSVDVDFDRTVDAQCMESEQAGEETILLGYDGLVEAGSSDVQDDGSSFDYDRYGAEGREYVLQYERRLNGATVYRETQRLLGNVEWLSSSERYQLRAVHSVEFGNHRGDEFHAAAGQPGAPFSLEVTLPSARIDGSYSYGSSVDGCAGGTARVATLDTLMIDQEGEIADGRLRITSAGRSATFSFNDDGSAVLDLNGATQAISREELEEAFNGDLACMPELPA